MAGSRAELSRLLRVDVKYQDQDQELCLAWVWAVTASSHMTSRGLSTEGAALRRRFFDRFPNLCSMNRAQKAFRRFFYKEELIMALDTG